MTWNHSQHIHNKSTTTTHTNTNTNTKQTNNTHDAQQPNQYATPQRQKMTQAMALDQQPRLNINGIHVFLVPRLSIHLSIPLDLVSWHVWCPALPVMLVMCWWWCLFCVFACAYLCVCVFWCCSLMFLLSWLCFLVSVMWLAMVFRGKVCNEKGELLSIEGIDLFQLNHHGKVPQKTHMEK